MSTVRLLHIQKVAGISGSETHLLALLPELAERGFDVRFLMLHEDEPGAWAFADAMTSRGIPVDAMPIHGDVDPGLLARLVGRLRAQRPTILHTHLVHADTYGLLAGAFARVPVLASTKHGFNEFRERRGFGFSDRNVARLAQLHIAISRGLAAYLEETEGFDARDFEIIHYGIAPDPVVTEPPAGPPIVLCVGRLIPIKGHIVLFRALAQARASVPELQLRVAGGGPLDEPLRELAHELRIDDAVTFLGHVSPIQPEIERATMMVVPSLGEGFGMVALEAMERQRPVIATAIGGLAEIVLDGETGVLVPPAAAEPLAEALTRLGRDQAVAADMGRRGRARALESFAQTVCTDRTVELYQRALGEASTAR